MNPDDLAKKIRATPAAEVASKAYTAADQVYRALTRPDRPLEPETGKKPWLAALLSLFIVGAGQLYNRQLAKALTLFFIFYLIGGALLLVFLILGWSVNIEERLPAWLLATFQHLLELQDAGKIIWGSIWLFGIVDAYLAAAALRAGKIVVRYGFFRQCGYALARCIPLASLLVPKETVAPEEVNKSVGVVVKDVAKEKIIERVVFPLLRIVCFGLGLLLLIPGVVFGSHLVVTIGALSIAIGVFLFLA